MKNWSCSIMSCLEKITEPKNKFCKIMHFTPYNDFQLHAWHRRKHKKPKQLVYPPHRTTELPSWKTTLHKKPKSNKPDNVVETAILMYFKINNTIVEIFQVKKKKEPHCILLHTRNPQTREKKIFAIIEGTLYFPFFETVFKLPHAIPSNLHLAELTAITDYNDVWSWRKYLRWK